MRRIQSKLHKPKICILLTATIDPKGVVFMERNDPLVRENDYINSIKKWIEKADYSIVFCENSGYNIDKIKSIIKGSRNNKIEILQFEGQDFPRELGKGYGELITINYAIEHSDFIKRSNFIIKINGRYYIENIKKIVNSLLKENDCYCMVDLSRDLTWGESRVFAFKSSFFHNYLSKFQDLLNDSKGFYLEHALARAVLRAVSDGHKRIPLPYKPIIIGYSGTSDASYRTSKIRQLTSETIHRVKNYLNRR